MNVWVIHDPTSGYPLEHRAYVSKAKAERVAASMEPASSAAPEAYPFELDEEPEP